MSALRDIAARIFEEHMGRPRSVIIDRFVGEVRDYHPDLYEAAIRECGEQYVAEIERRRREGLRVGYKVERAGAQLSLALLDLTFTEARDKVAWERKNARGAIEKAEYDAFALALARKNCVERGLDPDTVAGVLRDFTNESEVAEAWAAR